MRNGLFWLGALGICSVVGLSGCVKANIVFGQDQVDHGLTNIVKVDTLTPVMSTLFVDSIPTSGKGVAMMGGYDDPYFGSIQPRTYFELVPPPLTTLDPQAVFDSLVLYIVPNKYYYGDTTQPLDIYAEQIQSQMLFPPSQFSFYNNDSFAVRPTPLGHIRHLIDPHNPDTVYIHLDSTLGQTLFALMRTASQTITDPSQFLTFFPGIRISSGYGPNPQIVYGYKDSIQMKLWYHTPDLLRSINAMTFRFGDPSYQFMEVRNKPLPPLDQFQRGFNAVVEQIYSTAPGFDHQAFVNPLLGYVGTKVEFPSVRDMYLQDTTLRIISKAQLIVRPQVPSFSTQFQLPPALIMTATDLNNQPGPQISTGLLSLDYGGSDTQYSFDITALLQSELNDPSVGIYKKGGDHSAQPGKLFFSDQQAGAGGSVFSVPLHFPQLFPDPGRDILRLNKEYTVDSLYGVKNLFDTFSLGLLRFCTSAKYILALLHLRYRDHGNRRLQPNDGYGLDGDSLPERQQYHPEQPRVLHGPDPANVPYRNRGQGRFLQLYGGLFFQHV